MYVKLVRDILNDCRGCFSQKGCVSENVVPRETLVIECDRVDYRKYLAKNVKDSLELIKEKGYTILAYDYEFFKKHPFEFLFVSVKPNIKEYGEWINYFAPNYSLYILNNNGKTIDSIHCCDPFDAKFQEGLDKEEKIQKYRNTWFKNKIVEDNLTIADLGKIVK